MFWDLENWFNVIMDEFIHLFSWWHFVQLFFIYHVSIYINKSNLGKLLYIPISRILKKWCFAAKMTWWQVWVPNSLAEYSWVNENGIQGECGYNWENKKYYWLFSHAIKNCGCTDRWLLIIVTYFWVYL